MKTKNNKIKKTIRKKCLICNKRLTITVYADGHYRDAHYFGKMKIPIKNTGVYKKIGETNFLKHKSDVVKWTGKEIEAEYWECDSCFNKGLYEDWLEQMIEKLYGKRCPDYNKDCARCRAWGIYDCISEELRNSKK